MPGCRLPEYVGREVALEFAFACGDVDPATLSWAPVGAMRTKEFNATWDTTDATSDKSVGNVRTNLATYQTISFSGDGLARREDDTFSNLVALTKHFLKPGSAFNNQPVAYLRLTFPDITLVAYFILTTLSRSAPYDDVVTFSLEASTTSSDFGLVVTDTPQPPTAIDVLPATASKVIGATQQLTITPTPSDASIAVTWTSSAPSKATVNSSGLVTAVAAGTAIITARSVLDDSVLDTATITVTV